jgi:hypothetical protein
LPQEAKTSGESGGNSGRHRTQARAARREIPGRVASAARQVELSAALSASLIEELVREIAELGSGESAAQWAQHRLSAKNRLIAADAQRVEEAFAARLAAIGVPRRRPKDASRSVKNRSATTPPVAPQVDKSVLPFPEPRRIRDRDHIRYVIKQPCLICGRRPCDPHHLRFAQRCGLGRKASDEFTVPLCRAHHREVHRCADETAWWRKSGIDPLAAARALWLKTHPLPKSKSNEKAAGLMPM